MGNEYDVQVDDLVLFFQVDQAGQKTIVNRWLPYPLYTNPNLKMDSTKVPAAWADCVFSEAKNPGGQVYYMANLSRLVPPLPPQGAPPRATPGLPTPVPGTGTQPPTNGDLVIVPFDDASSYYRIPQAVYLACPAL